jgi:hypothetical protein
MELPTDAVPPERRYWLTAFIAGRQIRFCILILLIVVLMPPEAGLGIDLCMMHRMTGAPCPGCGVTRSGSNLFRGNFKRAIEYHPFGLILHPILVGLVCLSVLPGTVRAALARRMAGWKRVLQVLNGGFWFAFFAFGLIRWVAVMANVMSFPAPVGSS